MNSRQLEEIIQDLGLKFLNNAKQHPVKQQEFWESSTVPYTIVFRHPDSDTPLQVASQTAYLEYCTAAWSPHYCKDKELIEKVQRRFTRMIHDLKDLPYEQRLAKTKSLQDRRMTADLIEVYKIIHGLSTVSSNTFFEFSHNGITRGHSLKLQKDRVLTDLRQHFFQKCDEHGR